MPRAARLVIGCGLLGLLFFWATDPTWGVGKSLMDLVGASEGVSILDARRQALPGTVVGFVGSTLIVLVGLTMLTKKQP